MESRRWTKWTRWGASALSSAVLISLLASCSEGSPLFQGGVGTSESAPFLLADGSYQLAWGTSAQTPAGCRIAVELVAADEAEAVARVEGGTDSGGAAQGADSAGDLAAGSYYLRVESNCESWTAVVGEDAARRD